VESSIGAVVANPLLIGQKKLLPCGTPRSLRFLLSSITTLPSPRGRSHALVTRQKSYEKKVEKITSLVSIDDKVKI